MNNENEIFDENGINEILKMLQYAGYCDPNADRCRICLKCKYYFFAEALVNAGIGDKKQAVKEYIEELCNEFYIDTHLMVNGIDHRRYDCEAIQRAIYAIYDKLYGADE